MMVEDYLSQSDWRIKENANVPFSLGGLVLYNSGALTAQYWLDQVYPAAVAQAHRDADLHIHDLSMLSGYCAGWSLGQLIREGLGGVPNRISSKPAKHLSTLVNQMVNFLGVMQNEWAGAQAFSSFDTHLAPFVRADGLGYDEVKHAVQSFVFGVNTPSRWGSQAPFTNITLDWTVPADLRDRPAVVGGVDQPFTYGDCGAEMALVNRAFLETMLEGDADGRGFAYPIPTYNVTSDFDWDSDNARLLFQMTARYGTPYFQNFLNSDLDPSDVRSMCCRLRLDKRELRKRGGGLFGSDEFTGSIGVVTLNLPRVGYLAESREDLFRRLDALVALASESLRLKRTFVQGLVERGFLPYTRRYLKHLDNHFSTVGICGMNECLRNFAGVDISHTDGKALALDILVHLRQRLEDEQERTGDLYNLEATPAESTAYRFARHDKARFTDILTAGVEDPYYTNSTHLPVDATPDLFDALDHQEALQVLYTGGTVFHGFLGEAVTDWQACRALVRSIAENYRVPYYTVTPTYSICPRHGYLSGEHLICARCEAEGLESRTEVYTRIVGYYRPLSNWNIGKQEEYGDRREYSQWGERRGGKATSYLAFFSDHCPRCPAMKARLPELPLPGRIADDEDALRWSVSHVPTLILFNGGEELTRIVSAVDWDLLRPYL